MLYDQREATFTAQMMWSCKATCLFKAWGQCRGREWRSERVFRQITLLFCERYSHWRNRNDHCQNHYEWTSATFKRSCLIVTEVWVKESRLMSRGEQCQLCAYINLRMFGLIAFLCNDGVSQSTFCIDFLCSKWTWTFSLRSDCRSCFDQLCTCNITRLTGDT